MDIAHCSSTRIDALFFGGVDMAAELRCDNAWEPLALCPLARCPCGGVAPGWT